MSVRGAHRRCAGKADLPASGAAGGYRARQSRAAHRYAMLINDYRPLDEDRTPYKYLNKKYRGRLNFSHMSALNIAIEIGRTMYQSPFPKERAAKK
ncbi:MAG: hypothetical protein JWP38_1844 [Herbaspirillum sp.]|nr:hypothetical protein [Herbaspirillum sp.]